MTNQIKKNDNNNKQKIPSSSSDRSAVFVDERFQRKLRKGLFERDLRLTFAEDD